MAREKEADHLTPYRAGHLRDTYLARVSARLASRSRAFPIVRVRRAAGRADARPQSKLLVRTRIQCAFDNSGCCHGHSPNGDNIRLVSLFGI